MSPTDTDNLVEAMSLEEQVGQLLIALVDGPELSDEAAATLRDCHLSGVYIRENNVRTIEQLRALTARLQEVIGRPGLPAILAADQEGGHWQRLVAPATSFPSAMARGAAGSSEHAHRWGLATARELRAVGINTDFAPVFDVNNNPANPVIGIRSLGERVEEVTRLGLDAMAGLSDGGALTCAKHFPGHGDTDVDTHLGLPTLAHDPARLRAVELAPFKAAIDAGVPLIMTTHIIFTGLGDRDLPATLSSRVLRGLLRDELGFGGAIVSDVLIMKAIADRWGVAEGAVRFLEAGGDLILGTRDERNVYNTLLAAVRSGRLPREQIAASARRVARAKAWIAAQPPADPAWIGAAEHRSWSATSARDALTLLRDDAHLLPLRRDARLAVIDCAYEWTFLHDYELPATSALADALRPRFPAVRDTVVDGRAPTGEQRAAARAAVTEADVVLLATRGANRFPAQADFAQEVLGWGTPVVAVALNEPYDLLAYPAAPTALATYGDDPAMIAVLGAALAGEAVPGGRLPVSLPGLYPVGHRAKDA